MENNIENKTKYFAQHWGQFIAIQNEGGGSGFSYDINEATICDIKYDYLQLKPLSSITDEDKKAIEKIEDIGNDGDEDWINFGERFNSCRYINGGFQRLLLIQSYQYLQSKGYALSFMGLSVEKLIEYGWLKLKTEVSLEELAEILGVKGQFKIGDRVRCVNGVGDLSKLSKGLGWKEDKEFEVGLIRSTSSGICIHPDDMTDGVYEPFLELVSSPSVQEQTTVTISRANLGRIYPKVCTDWQECIDKLISKADIFAVGVEVPLETLKQAYREADYEQKSLLIEVAPLPKIKSTVKVSRWVNLYDQTNKTQKISSPYESKELAIDGRAHTGYITTVELTGEYTTEVEDPLMENIDELSF